MYGSPVANEVNDASGMPSPRRNVTSTRSRQTSVGPLFMTSPSHCWNTSPALGSCSRFELSSVRVGVAGLPASTTEAPGVLDTNDPEDPPPSGGGTIASGSSGASGGGPPPSGNPPPGRPPGGPLVASPPHA